MTRKALLPYFLVAALTAHTPSVAEDLARPKAPEGQANRDAYPVVVLDERFSAPSFRKGAIYDRLMASSGLWAAPGVWWSDQPWTPGYGFDLYPRLDVAPVDIYTIAKDGLRLRSRRFTDAELAKVPADQQTVARANNDNLRTVKRPWIGAHISTFYSLRVRPPFYVEIEASLPPATLGRVPWPALWLYTAGRNPTNQTANEAEVDIHEGFGPDGRAVLRSGMLAWNYGKDSVKAGPGEKRANLVGRHRYGAELQATGVRWTLDGVTTGFTAYPNGMAWNQPWYVLLDQSAGIPWNWPDAAGKMQPFLYPAPDAPPSDLIVHRVTWLAKRQDQIWRNGL